AFGYDSDSAFSHAFRRIKGLTPSEYRKTMRLKTTN
ncbi:TPA: AraC family transcriptional regulator, partial [Klebsiella quasipneumoniae subsp. similipneumoniae]